jgi:hypothetical protein
LIEQTRRVISAAAPRFLPMASAEVARGRAFVVSLLSDANDLSPMNHHVSIRRQSIANLRTPTVAPFTRIGPRARSEESQAKSEEAIVCSPD